MFLFTPLVSRLLKKEPRTVVPRCPQGMGSRPTAGRVLRMLKPRVSGAAPARHLHVTCASPERNPLRHLQCPTQCERGVSGWLSPRPAHGAVTRRERPCVARRDAAIAGRRRGPLGGSSSPASRWRWRLGLRVRAVSLPRGPALGQRAGPRAPRPHLSHFSKCGPEPLSGPLQSSCHRTPPVLGPPPSAPGGGCGRGTHEDPARAHRSSPVCLENIIDLFMKNIKALGLLT